MPEHFAAPPNWEWWILAYFFMGGIAGGSYALGTLIRLVGAPADQRAARIAFIVSFLALIPCPIFLIADLGTPLRFVNMLVDPSGGVNFKYWSPMSIGSWALLGFGLFSFVSFLGALGESGTRALDPFGRLMRGTIGAVWNVIGTGLGFFVSGYTGVLLAASNEPVWSDAAWVLGGLFLASALTGSAALLLLVTRSRRDVDAATAMRIEMADRNFVTLEAVLLVLFIVFVGVAGTLGKLLGVWGLLWIVILLGLAAPFVARSRAMRSWPPLAAPIIALLGVLALRALVIFGAQS
jgi:formate-dependent nitrite reductase membrane component NrfD